MRSAKCKRCGILMYLLAIGFLAVSLSDIILKKSYAMTYRYPWVGSLTLLLGFAFLTAGGLLCFWKQERPWRNTAMIAFGAVFITLTAGLFLTSDLKIQVSDELSSTTGYSENSTITWYNPETEETVIWHPYKTVFLKRQPDPITKVEKPVDQEEDKQNDAANPDAKDSDVSDEKTTFAPDSTEGIIERMKEAVTNDPALDGVETSIPGSVRVQSASADKPWVLKTAAERYAELARTDGKERHIQIERVEVTAGTPEDFLAKVNMTVRFSTLGSNDNPASIETKELAFLFRVMKGRDVYAAYRFAEDTASAAYGLEQLAASEVQELTGNDSYHFYMPAQYDEASYAALKAAPKAAIQNMYAAVFAEKYPNAEWFENNPQTGYRLSDTEYVIFYGITADLDYYQFRHYDISSGYPVTKGYYLMPFGTNEFILQ